MTRFNHHKCHTGISGQRYGTPDKFQPFLDKRVNSRIVVCPDCKAAVGDQCVTANGKRTQHRARRRLALRKLREMQDIALDTELPKEGGST